MSYLLDRKIKRKKFLYVVFFAIILLILFYFRLGIFSGLAYASHKIFRPVLILGNNIGEKVSNLGSFFVSKNSLYKQNENLKSQLNENKAMMINYNSVLAENINLKEILGRKKEQTNFILSAILSKPNQSLYDTLIIDVGTNGGVKIGNIIFALGNVPIGRVSDVYQSSSKIILFSNAGEKTQVVIAPKDTRPNDRSRPVGQVFIEIVGRGGGNFEMALPRDFTLSKGDQIVLPGINPYVLGTVQTIISDPRDPFVKALLVSPVNIQELKFVEVELQK
ncbi:MAG: Uncharacterized protein G01um101424_282 [Parcubacteria group bacterium Gr01-1014_24]|nr:MAG: Uncharacterized protein G01um101424_282 [Parcubacteria group bacterium Gr01-1014_24]